MVEMVGSLIKSAATFRRDLPEKLSFVALNCVDLVLTVLAMNRGLQEMNPLMEGWMFQSPLALILVKLVFPAIIAWLIPGKLLLPGIIFLSLVVLWYIKELLIFLF